MSCVESYGFRGVAAKVCQSKISRDTPASAGKKKHQGPLVIQCDEMWSFVGNKENKQWVWLAIDQDTGEIVGAFVGDRSQEGAQGLWETLPAVYRQCAVCYTDFWEAYRGVLPAKRHHAVGKETGKTNKIERFNGTLRQRVSRLVRKTVVLIAVVFPSRINRVSQRRQTRLRYSDE
jgi:insertion element IS1 protein InsB